MRKYHYLAFVLVLALNGCVGLFVKELTPQEIEVKRQKEFVQERESRIKFLSSFDFSDGVDEREANDLAKFYLWNYVSRCGAAGPVVDKGDHWEAELYVGYAATKLKKNLKIDKKSARIWTDLPDLPDIKDPQKDFLDDLGGASVVAMPPDEWTLAK